MAGSEHSQKPATLQSEAHMRSRNIAVTLLLLLVVAVFACTQNTSTGPGGSSGSGGISGTYTVQPVDVDNTQIEIFNSYNMYRFLSKDATYPQSTGIDSTGTWSQNGNTLTFTPHIIYTDRVVQPPSYTGTIEGNTITLNGKKYTR